LKNKDDYKEIVSFAQLVATDGPVDVEIEDNLVYVIRDGHCTATYSIESLYPSSVTMNELSAPIDITKILNK